MAVIGALATRFVTLGSRETVSEWLSAQALYAAESGVEWAARDLAAGGAGVSAGANVDGNSSFTTVVATTTIDLGGGDVRRLYTITSTGSAGSGVSAVQRELVVQFMPR